MAGIEVSGGGGGSSAPDLSSIYHRIYSNTARIAAGTGASTLIPVKTTSPNASGSALASNPESFDWIHLRAADFAVAGKTAQLRVAIQVQTNDTAPAVTFTANLRPVTSTTCAASQVELTAGAAVSGSDAVVATPAALSLTTDESGLFDLPADGVYVVAIVTSGGATAASSSEVVAVQLDVTWV
jgi:hypothetical protein